LHRAVLPPESAADLGSGGRAHGLILSAEMAGGHAPLRNILRASTRLCRLFQNSNYNRLPPNKGQRGRPVFLGTILLIVLVLFLLGALPTWPYSTGWGYYPSGGLGLIVIVLLILVVTGRL
jgi:hypothetical protein